MVFWLGTAVGTAVSIIRQLDEGKLGVGGQGLWFFKDSQRRFPASFALSLLLPGRPNEAVGTGCFLFFFLQKNFLLVHFAFYLDRTVSQ